MYRMRVRRKSDGRTGIVVERPRPDCLYLIVVPDDAPHALPVCWSRVDCEIA